MSVNVATLLVTEVVISSGIANVNEVLSTLPVHTRPACKVAVADVPATAVLNDTCAFAAVLERGTYPMLRASETTFSLSVAESKKDSFTIMLELNALI